MEKKFWLVTTEHLSDRLWFKDQDDFKAGMNLVALLAVTMPVVIWAFILMSNHVHFVLYCSEIEARAFICKFKKRYSQFYSYKYGRQELLRNNSVDIREIPLDGESLERAIAYVLMNCVAANICLQPSGYPWGSGSVYYNLTYPKGRRADEFSGRRLTALMHSRTKLPGHFTISENGYVHPSSYVPVSAVEKMFRSPKRMDFFLRNSSKAKRLHEVPSFSDLLINTAIKDLCISLFRKGQISELSTDQLRELLKQIRYRFSADPAQIARVAGITYETVCLHLDAL